MQLSTSTGTQCTIKTRSATISVDGELKIGDLVLPGPGEYEANGVFAEVDRDIAHFHTEDMVLVYLGHQKRKVTEEELGHLENVDILLVAVDSEAKEELENITKLIRDIEPRVVVLTGITNPEAFTKVGSEAPESVKTLKLIKSELPDEGRRVYVLTP